MSSLIQAVKQGDVAKVRALLSEGAFVDEAGPDGRTPLHEAAIAGNVEMVKTLLAAKADVTFKDEEKETAILKAAAHGHREVVNLLAPLASEDDRDMARAFLKHHANPHALPPREEEPETTGDSVVRGTATFALRASAFFGSEKAQKQLDRIERAEKNKKR